MIPLCIGHAAMVVLVPAQGSFQYEGLVAGERGVWL